MVTINQSIDEKKWINFVKIKFPFEWRYWMTLHATWI
jgi:hypothetical protein